MVIYGTDNAGVDWTGAVDLDSDDDGNVSGTIKWRSSEGYYGTETVVGSLNGCHLNLQGVRVHGSGLVCCTYRGTWSGNRIDISWVGHCPSGRAS